MSALCRPRRYAGQTRRGERLNGVRHCQSQPASEQAWQYIHYLTSQPVQDKYAKLSLPV